MSAIVLPVTFANHVLHITPHSHGPQKTKQFCVGNPAHSLHTLDSCQHQHQQLHPNMDAVPVLSQYYVVRGPQVKNEENETLLGLAPDESSSGDESAPGISKLPARSDSSSDAFPRQKRRVLSLYTEAETNIHLDDEPVEKYSSSSGEENAVKPEPFGETMAATEIGTNKTQITEDRLERSEFLKKLNELSRDELADPKKRAYDDEHAFADAFDGDSSPDSYRYESDSGLDHSNTSEIDSDGEKTKNKKNKKSKRIGDDAVEPGPNTFPCLECTNEYASQTDLDAHSVTHNRNYFNCTVCYKQLTTKLSLVLHMRRHTGEMPVACTLCDFRTYSQRGLIPHMKRHNGENPHACEECPRSFKTESALVAHSRIHSGDVLNKCTVCEKQLSSREGLTVHMRLHSGEKPYKCDECGKAFSRSHHLKSHALVHTGEKPWKCTLCEKGLSTKKRLEDHMRTHTGEKPYACDICGKCFAASANLASHKEIHAEKKPFECHICHKRLSSRQVLGVHIRNHNGEKPFQCKHCDKSFSASGSLIKHTRIHTGEKPYECKVCHMRFAISGSVTKHMKIHAREQEVA